MLTTMARKKSLSEKNIHIEFCLLQDTNRFLVSEQKKIIAKLNYYLKRLEDEYSEQLQEICEKTHVELQNITKKINWEIKRCGEFDAKVQQFNRQKQNQFISGLAKRILGKKE